MIGSHFHGSHVDLPFIFCFDDEARHNRQLILLHDVYYGLREGRVG